MEALNMLPGIITLFFIVMILPFLLFYIKQNKEKTKIIYSSINCTEKKRNELATFIEENKLEFFSQENLDKLNSIESTLKEIREELSNFKKNAKEIKREIREETVKIVDDAESKITGFYFDPFRMQRTMAEGHVEFMLKIQNLSSKMDFKFLEVRVLILEFEIFFGKILPEVKKRPDFLEKCKNYMQSEIVTCKTLLDLKEKKLLSKRIERSKIFLEVIKVSELDVFEERFKTFNFE